LLSDFTEIDSTVPAGLEGAWLVSDPIQLVSTLPIYTGFAVRFVPDISTANDPGIEATTTEVVTYISSRTDVYVPTNTTNTTDTSTNSTDTSNGGLFTDFGFRLRSGSFEDSSGRWHSEEAQLECWNDDTCNFNGASTISTVGAILAACATLFVF